QKTPFTFDVSVWELLSGLSSGGRLVMARPDGHKDPGHLGEVIRAAGVTVVHFVPSMLQAFLEQDVESGVGCLRAVICSGEALSAPLVRRFHERVGGVDLHNLYGPTEAAVDVTSWSCAAEWSGTQVPIGRPVWNTQ